MILEGGSLSGRERNCVFLNTRGARFGNVSAVSGLDFPDDGRALATLDWDHDGDLDLWLVNRTGPQIRFLRNDAPTQAHFLRVRLTGHTSNRDGIGARLELHLKDASARKMIKTVRAGEGYLSQSSKWVHFGLGRSSKIDRLVVRWPGGEAETFAGLKADQRYRLHQGTGKAELWVPPQRRVSLVPGRLDSPRGSLRAHTRLGVRVPLGPLAYRDLDNVEKSLHDFRGKPLLVNLWATWCAPCVKELGEFARREQTLRDRGLEILALSVDGLGDGHSADWEQVRQRLTTLQFRFPSGRATRELLTNLEVLRNGLFKWGRPFVVPTSFLIDARGWLAAIYTGPVEVEELLADLDLMDAPPEQLRAQAIPFEGRWLEPPPETTVSRWFAKRASDHHDAAKDLAAAGRVEDAMAQHRQALALRPDYADAHNDLGAILAGQGRSEEAVAEYRKALQIDADLSEAHNNLGVALLKQPGRLDEAIEHFRRALESRPERATVHESLGMALAQQGKVAEAETHFREAIRIKPDYAGGHLNLGVALFSQQKVEEALRHYRKALELKSDSLDAHLRIADILGRQDKFAEAIHHSRTALRINPDHPVVLNLLALALVTRRPMSVGDADEAVRRASRAVELTNHGQPAMLYTLTLAYEAAGRFEEAARTAEEVLPFARSSGQTQIVADIERRLELYREKTCPPH